MRNHTITYSARQQKSRLVSVDLPAMGKQGVTPRQSKPPASSKADKNTTVTGLVSFVRVVHHTLRIQNAQRAI
jgi:hypothetical protein